VDVPEELIVVDGIEEIAPDVVVVRRLVLEVKDEVNGNVLVWLLCVIPVLLFCERRR
jgi:hypothetical protein